MKIAGTEHLCDFQYLLCNKSW